MVRTSFPVLRTKAMATTVFSMVRNKVGHKGLSQFEVLAQQHRVGKCAPKTGGLGSKPPENTNRAVGSY